MDEFDDEGEMAEVYTHFTFKIKVVRVIENILVPSSIHFKMEFMTMETAEENQIDLAFSKMRYWLDNVVSKSVIFSHENADAIKMFIDEENGTPRLGNVIVLTPHEPDDQHLAAIFQSKLQALANSTMVFGPVEVQSDNQLGLQFTFVGDSNSVLPKIEEWVGKRSFFDKPWWERDDGSTLDVLPADDADLSVKPSWAFSFDFLSHPKPIASQGKIVRPDFKPTVIDGGKK